MGRATGYGFTATGGARRGGPEMESVSGASQLTVLDDGTRRWYRPGTTVLHRTDGPAVEYPDGQIEYLVDGKRHRDDGPAVIHPGGALAWYRNGQRHRDDGPALIHANGANWWFRHGELHRDDGPAVSNGATQEFWLHGHQLSEREFARMAGRLVRDRSTLVAPPSA